MRPRSFALLMLALGCGLVASIGITMVIERRNREPAASSGATRPVFVALADVDQGEVLTLEVLKLEQWPKDKVPQGAISRIQDIEGRRTRTKLFATEPILENKLFPRGYNQQGATGLIPKGYRVVPVKVDLVSGGSSLILPGDRVDVMVHLVRNPSRDIPETVTRTILQDIKVFAVNDVVDIEKSKESDKSIAAKTISLLVTPEQAAKVMLASQLGTIQLVMRSPADQQNAPNVEARPSELFGTTGAGDRKKESASESQALSEQVKGLQEWLASMKSKPPVVTAAAAPKLKTIWRVRILKPDDIEEVPFEMEEQTTAGPWWGVWKEKSAPDDNAAADAPASQDAKPTEPQTAPTAAAAVQKLPPAAPSTSSPSAPPSVKELLPQEHSPASLEQSTSAEGASTEGG